ncbi:MAG: hypothetical protein EXX96DRAFT_605773 [Benjaminiella poitrasii]|nr:MAG: hypothetical protein EXX96DRAFT_605773 [Benjaminiella poitrasii]
MKAETGIKTIEIEIPTSLFQFYGFKSTKFIFNNYQGLKRIDDELVNMLIDSNKKYNKKSGSKQNRTNKGRRSCLKGMKLKKKEKESKERKGKKQA